MKKLYKYINFNYFSRITSVGFLLLLFFGVSVDGFSQNVSPKKHALKVFQNTENNTLYWPVELPFYVWVSDSDRTDGKKYLLNNMEIRNDDGKKDTSINKIELEMSGKQFLRWVNFQTKDTLMLMFQADGIAPKSSVNLKDAPKFVKGDKTYFGKQLKAVFSSIDAHSGVEQTLVSVNGGDFSAYFGELDFNQQREYHIAYYGVDNVGNVEKVKEIDFIVDLNAPETKSSVSGIHQGSVLAPSAKIVLSSSDELSGVEAISYGFSEDAITNTYSKPISVSQQPDGNHTLYFRATDRVRNEERINTFQFYVDSSPPKTELIVEGDQHKGSYWFVSARTKFRFKSTDNKTGVKEIVYGLNSSEKSKFNNELLSFPAKEQNYSISFQAKDNIENLEAEQRQEFSLDLTPPKTIHSFDGAHFSQRGITWIHPKTQIVLTSADKHSGVKNIFYTVGTETVGAKYSQPLNIRNEGNFDLQFWADDNVNNVEESHSQKIVVDNTAPKIIINYSSSKIGSNTATDGSVLDMFPPNTVMYIAATDESSGAKGIWVQFANKKEVPFTSPLTFSEIGEQNLTVRSEDHVGNQTQETLRFIIADN